eukprot:11156581-Lingulodinium_polyedra.AAC.1
MPRPMVKVASSMVRRWRVHHATSTIIHRAWAVGWGRFEVAYVVCRTTLRSSCGHHGLDGVRM